MTNALDRRLHAYRDDRAAAPLRGQVHAVNFIDGVQGQVSTGIAALRRKPGIGEALDTQLIHGDCVMIYEFRADGWLWLQNIRDGYVGYVRAEAVSQQVAETSHRVRVLRTFVYPEANMKKPPMQILPLAAEVAVYETRGDFSRIADNQWVWSTHLSDKAHAVDDYVSVAEMMEGAPYLWGGNTPDGTDCSGLVQTALRMANRTALRDSDMQEAELGENRPLPDALNTLQRGDLVFWKGHVGVMVDANILLHANGFHMLVVREPVQVAIARITAKGGGPVTSVRRVNP